MVERDSFVTMHANRHCYICDGVTAWVVVFFADGWEKHICTKCNTETLYRTWVGDESGKIHDVNALLEEDSDE